MRQFVEGPKVADRLPKRSMVSVVNHSVYFYVEDEKPLNGNVGYDLFELLMGTPSDIQSAKDQSVSHVDSGVVPNYLLWGDNSMDWADGQGSCCGIFVAGDRNSADTWFATPDTTWNLKFILDNTGSGDSVHWLCCRTWL